MACNCKRAQKFEEENGVKQEEMIATKLVRYGYKCLFFTIAVLSALIAVPFLVFYAVYAITFGNNKITLPKFMRKYLE